MDSALKFTLDNLFYVAMAALSGGMLLWQTIKGTGANQISPQEATLLINRADAVILDIRNVDEWNTGHISGARHIALDQLERQITSLEKLKTAPVIVVCQSGGRSGSACGLLKRHGFEKIYNLSGGLAAWRDAGFPVTAK